MQQPWYYRLECPVQDYDWGNPDENGIIRKLLNEQNRPLAPGTPAAELWMGAHPKAPAQVLQEERSLEAAISASPEHFLGQRLSSAGVKQLPFLFKVLDAALPLSIQAHPDKALAEVLNQRDPANYPDDNHKPELAISLGEMSALLGFRAALEIVENLNRYPELERLCKTAVRPKYGVGEKEFIKAAYGALMQTTALNIQASANELIARLKGGSPSKDEVLFLRLVELYGPADPGIFCVFFLNHIKLEKGQGVFLGPNEPHAYLGGPILECMAASDNVVRAGLTKKFCDVETLVSMLHYQNGPAQILEPTASNGSAETYQTPAKEFQVKKLLPKTEWTGLNTTGLPSILLVLDGEITLKQSESGEELTLTQGSTTFLPGDLSDRNLSLEMQSPKEGQFYLATVHPEF